MIHRVFLSGIRDTEATLKHFVRNPENPEKLVTRARLLGSSVIFYPLHQTVFYDPQCVNNKTSDTGRDDHRLRFSGHSYSCRPAWSGHRLLH